MEYPIGTSYVDIISDYYKNHATKEEKAIIDDCLSTLVFDLGFTLDDRSTVITNQLYFDD